MSKGDRPDVPPPAPHECASEYRFSVDQITSAGNLERAKQLHIGDQIEVRLDPQKRAAVFLGEAILGWPSRYGPELEECLNKGYRFPGRVVNRRGLVTLPHLEVLVTGIPGA